MDLLMFLLGTVFGGSFGSAVAYSLAWRRFDRILADLQKSLPRTAETPAEPSHA